MTRKTEEAIEALRGTYVKAEVLKEKQRNLLKALKSLASDCEQRIDLSVDAVDSAIVELNPYPHSWQIDGVVRASAAHKTCF